MGKLHITLFGSMRITHNNWQTEVTLTREVQALLAYLLLNRHRVHSREHLAGMFWGEYSQARARGSLNTALWKLRKSLEPDGTPVGTYLTNGRSSEVGFNRESQYWLDVEVFERHVNRVLGYPFQTVEETDVMSLEKELELYEGGLLEGFHEDWVVRERERLCTVYLNSLIYLLQYHALHGAYEKAITHGQQILYLDPLREEIHQELMRLYVGNGQRTLAIRQYEKCCTTLATELDILPMEDTRLLYAQILAENRNISSLLPDSGQISVEQAIKQLLEAERAIDLAKQQIQQTLQIIAQYSERQD